MKIALLAAVVAALAVPAAQASMPTLKGTVGPGFTITLTKAGKKVTKLKAGTYKVVIADKAGVHNFHLTGPGVNKKTGVKTRGKVTWNLTLVPGTYTYRSDKTKKLRGTFTVRFPA